MRKFATGGRVNRGAPLPPGVYFRNLLSPTRGSKANRHGHADAPARGHTTSQNLLVGRGGCLLIRERRRLLRELSRTAVRGKTAVDHPFRTMMEGHVNGSFQGATVTVATVLADP